MKKILTRIKAALGKLRILHRLKQAEANHASLLAVLSYCEDCSAVMFGPRGQARIQVEGEVHVYCRWCAQKYKANALQKRRQGAR